MKHLLTAIVLLLASRTAWACSCAGIPTVEQARERADVVFAGIVESIEDPGGDAIRSLPREEQIAAQRAAGYEWGPKRGLKVTFRTLQWWKGEQQPETIELWTGHGGGDCGYPVEKGQSFLVYGRRTLMNKQCLMVVDAVIGRDGAVRDFTITRTSSCWPDARVREQVTARIAEWRFRPAMIDDMPVEVKLRRISMREPYTEADFERFANDREQRLRDMKAREKKE